MKAIKDQEFEKSKVYDVVAIGEYSHHKIVAHRIINKSTGSISTALFDKGEQLMDKLSRFDNFIQIVEGTAEILIDDESFTLNTGQAIIIPANSKNTIIANERFKMMSTIIKSGYE